MSNQPGHDRLLHIRQSIGYIEGFTAGGESEFRSSRLIQHAVLYDLLVIGEAARALSPEVQAQLPGIEWRRIVGLRNILTHEYYKVDLDVIWGILRRHLPELKNQITEVMEKDADGE